MALHRLVDVFLKLGLLFAIVHVIDQGISCLSLDSHELGLAAVALAVDVFHDLVIGTQLFLVLSK